MRLACTIISTDSTYRTWIKTGGAVSEDLDEGYGVEEAIIEANEDDSVHGIMVEPPFFEVYGLTYTCFFKVYFPIFWSTAGI